MESDYEDFDDVSESFEESSLPRKPCFLRISFLPSTPSTPVYPHASFLYQTIYLENIEKKRFFYVRLIIPW